jgi:uncharacterized DUF497 family protein
MDFEWDPAKSERNERLRGFGFAYASTVFFDDFAIENFNRIVDGEDRYQIIGSAVRGEILFVVYTWVTYEETTNCRIISARLATPDERRRYQELR